MNNVMNLTYEWSHLQLHQSQYFLFIFRDVLKSVVNIVNIFNYFWTAEFQFISLKKKLNSYLCLLVAMFIIFRGKESNIFHHPIEAMMGMFIMSLGEFADIYESFANTEYPDVPKVCHKI